MAGSAIQLYSLRNVEGSFLDLLETVADAGFDAVEYAYRVTEAEASADEIADALDDLGLVSAGAHVGIDTLENDTAETVAFFETLGCTDLVVPSLPADHFASEAAVEDAAERMATLADDLDSHGVDLHYHNHDHEFVDLGETTAFERFVDLTDERVGIEIDAGLALAAGADPADLVRRAGDRADLFHLKDYDLDAGESAPAGRGDVDAEACAEAFQEVGGEWLIYEYERDDVLDTLEESGTFVSGLVR